MEIYSGTINSEGRFIGEKSQVEVNSKIKVNKLSNIGENKSYLDSFQIMQRRPSPNLSSSLKKISKLQKRQQAYQLEHMKQSRQQFQQTQPFLEKPKTAMANSMGSRQLNLTQLVANGRSPLKKQFEPFNTQSYSQKMLNRVEKKQTSTKNLQENKNTDSSPGVAIFSARQSSPNAEIGSLAIRQQAPMHATATSLNQNSKFPNSKNQYVTGKQPTPVQVSDKSKTALVKFLNNILGKKESAGDNAIDQQQVLGPLDITKNAAVIRHQPKQLYKGIKQSTNLKRKRYRPIDVQRFSEQLNGQFDNEGVSKSSTKDLSKTMVLPLNALVLNLDTPIRAEESKNDRPGTYPTSPGSQLMMIDTEEEEASPRPDSLATFDRSVIDLEQQFQQQCDDLLVSISVSDGQKIDQQNLNAARLNTAPQEALNLELIETIPPKQLWARQIPQLHLAKDVTTVGSHNFAGALNRDSALTSPIPNFTSSSKQRNSMLAKNIQTRNQSRFNINPKDSSRPLPPSKSVSPNSAYLKTRRDSSNTFNIQVTSFRKSTMKLDSPIKNFAVQDPSDQLLNFYRQHQKMLQAHFSPKFPPVNTSQPSASQQTLLENHMYQPQYDRHKTPPPL